MTHGRIGCIHFWDLHKSILTAENPYGTSARDTLVGLVWTFTIELNTSTQQTQNVPLMFPNGPMRLFFGEPNKNVIRTFHFYIVRRTFRERESS